MICAKFLFPWGRCWCRTFELSSKRLIQYFSHDLNQCPSHYERFSQIQVVLIQIRYVHHHFGVPKLVKRFVSLNCSAETIWVQKKNPRSCWLSLLPVLWAAFPWNGQTVPETIVVCKALLLIWHRSHCSCCRVSYQYFVWVTDPKCYQIMVCIISIRS